MTVTFMRATPDRPRPDPAKHVHYTYGMLLGVDDFTQEFAYLSGRDRTVARSGIGYGTVGGLRVTYEPEVAEPARGPRVVVSPGMAIAPSGQLVCVCPAQCADLDAWLEANRAALDVVFDGAAPGDVRPVTASVVLGYAECHTDDVPIPGEPCRSEENLTEPSRVRDDFLLDLRLHTDDTGPPDQREEEAVRRFVAWLRRVRVDADADIDVAGFTAAMLAAAGLDPPPADGPTLATFFPSDLPDPPAVPAAPLFLRTAFRIWVTQLLPHWRAVAADCGCTPAAPGAPAPADLDRVTLATLVVRVQRTDLVPGQVPYAIAADEPPAGEGEPGRPGVTVIEEQEADPDVPRDAVHRPVLVDLRVLQEWALTEPAAPVAEPVTAQVVAGGRFDEDGAAPAPPFFTRGGLTLTRRAGGGAGQSDVFDLAFDGFVAGGDYVVTGSVVLATGAAGHGLEVVPPEADDAPPGVRIRRVGAGSPDILGVMLQVTRFGP